MFESRLQAFTELHTKLATPNITTLVSAPLVLVNIWDAASRIMRVSQLPVSVDIESAYRDNPAEVVTLVTELVNLGVVGINLEDGE